MTYSIRPKRFDKARILTLIPALWASILDITLTICGQPSAYWNGNFKVANERNPIGAFVMSNHVSGLFVISGIWIALIVLLGYYLPRKISRIFLLFVLIANSWGASSWIAKDYWFVGSLALFLINAILYILIDEMSTKARYASTAL
jgi:hypothetical protein